MKSRAWQPLAAHSQLGTAFSGTHVAAAAAVRAQVQHCAEQFWLRTHTGHNVARAGWHCAVHQTGNVPVPQYGPAKVWTSLRVLRCVRKVNLLAAVASSPLTTLLLCV